MHSRDLHLRTVLALLLLNASAWGPALNDASAQPKGTARTPVVLAINEGATTQVSSMELRDRYQPLANTIQGVLGRPVKLEVFPETPRFRNEFAHRSFDIVFGKTVNVLAAAVRDKQYQPVVKTKAPYVAGFIIARNSPLKSPADMRGKTVIMPERVFTTKLGEAKLRDLGFKPGDVTIRYTRLQESVATAVESGLADVGVVNPTVKREWKEKGNPVLLEAKPVPNWTIIAARSISEADVARLRKALVDLKDSPQGMQVLKPISVPEFVGAEKAEYVDLLNYIRE